MICLSIFLVAVKLLAQEFNIGKLTVQIRPSFIAVCLLMATMQLYVQFILLFAVVTMHELTHVLTARLFGINTERIIITPVGQAAQIDELYKLPIVKRLLVIISGPLINLLIACGGYLLFTDNTPLFVHMNFIIAMCNLLPITPLDGGRVLHCFISRYKGVIPANKICKKLSRIIAVFLIFTGVVQTTLYSYNITILLASFYLYKLSDSEYLLSTFNFYKMLYARNKTNKYMQLSNIKCLFLPHNTLIKDVFALICFDFIQVFYIFDLNEKNYNEKNTVILTEYVLVSYVEKNGIGGCIGDIIDLGNY